MKNGNDKAKKAADIVIVIDGIQTIFSRLIATSNNNDEINKARENFVETREKLIHEIVSIATNDALPHSQEYQTAYKDICRILIPCRKCLIKKAL